MGVTSRTEPIVNYQDRENIIVKDHKINDVTHQTDNTIIRVSQILCLHGGGDHEQVMRGGQIGDDKKVMGGGTLA